jgi:hypothetical protein
MKTSIKTLRIFIILIITSTISIAKDMHMPLQVSLITPIGSNGMNSSETSNNISINLIYGIHKNINDVEISGFGSHLKGKMNGVQIAGFINTVNNEVNGVQLAGFHNLDYASVNGVTIAGFMNYVNEDSKSTQIAGFGNFNLSSNKGTQIAGFINTIADKHKGVQVAGFMNKAKESEGTQLAGFCNITDKVEGVQIAGFMNIAKKLSGTQIGIINICDSVQSGIPVGIISIVKNGYSCIELASSESFHAVASYKIGIKEFYSIFSFGASYRNEKKIWGLGYGLGSMFNLNTDWSLTTEVSSYQISQDKWFNNNSRLNKLQVSFARNLDFMDLFLGVSWNVVDSKKKDNYTTEIIPYDLFDHDFGSKNHSVKMYPGFSAGIRF